MRSIQLPDHVIQSLDALTLQTGKSIAYHARRAIAAYLEDMEDIRIATARLRNPTERLTLEQVEGLIGDAVAG
jgi:predicted DNA-binding protein